MQRKKENLRINLIFNIINQVVAVLSPLIVTPKIARVFGVDYLGIKSYTFSIVYYFAVFGVIGLDMYGQRKIAFDKDDLKRRSRAFWTIYLTRLILVFLSIIGYVFIIPFISSSAFERIVFYCWIIYLIREMINPIWFLQGMEKYKLISILGIVSQLGYVICTVLFINTKEQLPLYIVFYTAIPLAISVMYFPIVCKNVIWVGIEKKEVISTLRESVAYFIPTIATAIYSMVDKTMLGHFDPSKRSTGLYESAERLVKVAITFTTASFTIMRTRMSYIVGQQNSKEYKSNSKYFISLSMLLCWPIMFGIIGISNDFVPLFFGSGFEEVISLSYVFSLVIPCLTISGLIQAIYIFPYGLQKTMGVYYGIIVGTNVILNLILIRRFGTIGAITASIFAELLLAILLIYRARDVLDVSFIFRSSIKYLISSGTMLLMMAIISSHLNTSALMKVMVEFIAGVIVYFLVVFLLNDQFAVHEAKNVFRKIVSLIRRS